MPGETLIWVDGVASRALPLPDRGLDYGDGVFETILLVGGKPLFLHLHLSRLELGLAALHIPDCLAEVKCQIENALIAVPHSGEAVMRVTVTRGAGPRGYASPIDSIPRVVLSVYQSGVRNFRLMERPASISLTQIRWGFQLALGGVKHLNRLEQVLAATEKQHLGVDEVLMLDHQEAVVSMSAANIFALIDGQLVTPILRGCGVMGTRRRLLLETLAPALGLTSHEATLCLDDLKEATEVFYCNAITGFRPVGEFAERRWNSFEVCTAVHKLYCERAC